MAQENMNIHQVSLAEAFNNESRKTSANKLVGIPTCYVCLFMFVILIIYYFCKPTESEVVLSLIDKTIMLFGIGGGILGVKTISSAIGGARVTVSNDKEEQKNEE